MLLNVNAFSNPFFHMPSAAPFFRRAIDWENSATAHEPLVDSGPGAKEDKCTTSRKVSRTLRAPKTCVSFNLFKILLRVSVPNWHDRFFSW